ncbi:MAG: ATP-dependent DNA ligase [archaeon]
MHFSVIAEYFERIEKASSRLEMTSILKELFEKSSPADIQNVVYLTQGKLAPDFEGVETGLGEKFVVQAIAKTTGYSIVQVQASYKSKGDLGLVAEHFIEKKAQKSFFSQPLTLHKVHENLLKISKTGGTGSQQSKIRLLAELLNSAMPSEAKFIVRVPLGNLRLGAGDPTLMDALAGIYSKELLSEKKLVKELTEKHKLEKLKSKEKQEQELMRRLSYVLRERIEDKFNIFADLGLIAVKLKDKGVSGLNNIKISFGIPIRPALAERLETPEEIFKKIGVCLIEPKLDGFRVQLHKNDDKVKIFSRHAEEMTEMFPEIIQAAKKQIKAKSVILEGEALAFNEEAKEFYPFQVTIQRKRKYDIEKMSRELPLKLFAFDILMLNDKNLLDLNLSERHKLLEETILKGETIIVTDNFIAKNSKVIRTYFATAVEKGLEGIMAKDLKSKYIPGARKFAWVKLKRLEKGRLLDSLDVVIIGFFKGRGKRTQFGLGALLTACYDKKEDCFKSLAKIGTGLSETQLKDLSTKLSKIKSSIKPVRVLSDIVPDYWVKPKYVIEVRADEITESPTHLTAIKQGKGLALRFPRMMSYRDDKKPEDATTEKEIISLYKKQKTVSVNT